MIKECILTFDIEEPEHMNIGSAVNFSDNAENFQAGLSKILALLKKNNISATFFVVAELGLKYQELIANIVADGHELALHSLNHKLIYKMTPEEFESDLTDGKNILEKISKKPLLGYRAPSWSVSKKHTPWFWEILSKHGFKYSSSLFPIWTPLYGSSGSQAEPHNIKTSCGSILEIPVPAVRFILKGPFSGGVYFRILPDFVRTFFERLWIKRGLPLMYYFHLRDIGLEIPPDELSYLSRLVNYKGSISAQKRFERLIARGQFISFDKILGQLKIIIKKE
ncbi:polysaccharide deacetylase family protein [Candidatus Giovannonibacteria bacterium]|nr:polysaccharide deacetylase family protein [Candidatus Giovannonibacteria bacterium]